MASMILHVTTHGQWEDALSRSVYHDQSLAEEGFIHCSTPEQIVRSANKHYHGQSNLVLLCIIANQLTSPLVYEDSYNTGEKFPHIYGPLNLDAVTYVVDLPVNNDGTFSLREDFLNQIAQNKDPRGPRT